MREEIYRMKQRDPAAKVLIFSQFTSMLDILHYRLTQVQLTGSGTVAWECKWIWSLRQSS